MSCADGSLVAGRSRALAALVALAALLVSDQLVLGLVAGAILGIALAVIVFVEHREQASAPPKAAPRSWVRGARRAHA
jgi:hypothetical protein